jgi:hypothetical protein
MSQRSVERVLGRLVTDEGFRRRFAADRAGVLAELDGRGLDLNPCERAALAGLDLAALGRYAEKIDPRLLKTDLEEACK